MSMDSLYEIAGNPRGWAAERAAMVIAIKEQVDAGQVSSAEAKELMLDLVRMDTLDQEADDMELKTALIAAIYAVSRVV